MPEGLFQTSLVVEPGGYRVSCTCGYRSPEAYPEADATTLGREHAASHPAAPAGSTVPLTAWTGGRADPERAAMLSTLGRIADALDAIAEVLDDRAVNVVIRERAT